MLIPHIVIGGGVGLAAASGSNTILLKIGLIVFATGWMMVIGLVILSVKANSHNSRLDEEVKVCDASELFI